MSAEVFEGIIFVVILVGFGAVALYQRIAEANRKKEQERIAEENRQRKAAELKRKAAELFRDDISDDDFRTIVSRVGRSIKRLESLSVAGHRVNGTVWAQSGISSWDFIVDYDSYGHLSSAYSIRSDNQNSNIPREVAKRIAKGIKEWVPGKSDSAEPAGRLRARYCPYCGAAASDSGAYCPDCGAELPLVPSRK